MGLFLKKKSSSESDILITYCLIEHAIRVRNKIMDLISFWYFFSVFLLLCFSFCWHFELNSMRANEVSEMAERMALADYPPSKQQLYSAPGRFSTWSRFILFSRLINMRYFPENGHKHTRREATQDENYYKIYVGKEPGWVIGRNGKRRNEALMQTNIRTILKRMRMRPRMRMRMTIIKICFNEINNIRANNWLAMHPSADRPTETIPKTSHAVSNMLTILLLCRTGSRRCGNECALNEHAGSQANRCKTASEWNETNTNTENEN